MRPTVLPVDLLVLIGFVAAVGVYSCAYAAPVFRAEGGGTSVVLRLLDKPCTDEKVLAHIGQQAKTEFRSKFKAAELTYNGTEWKSCWLLFDGDVYSIDEAGDPLQKIPYNKFKDDAV